MKNKYCAVIVVFYPNKIDLIKKIKTLLKLNIFVVLVNNTPDNSLNIKIQDNKRILIINNKKNYGIAKAQNQAIKYLKSQSFNASFFFDQDSIFSGELISNLTACLSKDINIIGPICIDANTNKEIPSITMKKYGQAEFTYNKNQKYLKKVSLIISSGSLIKLNVFDKVGLFDENLFLDYVDLEWCFRCIKFKEQIYIDPKSTLEHKIGNGIKQLLFFKTIMHSPFRTYYKIKNPILLLKFSHIPKIWVLKEIVSSFKGLLIILILDKKRFRHIHKSLLGIKDALICMIK